MELHLSSHKQVKVINTGMHIDVYFEILVPLLKEYSLRKIIPVSLSMT